MSLSGCQINLIDVIFHLQKSLEIFDKKSADKICFKKDRWWKVPSLMPIRVGSLRDWKNFTSCCTAFWVDRISEFKTLTMNKQIEPQYLHICRKVGNFKYVD